MVLAWNGGDDAGLGSRSLRVEDKRRERVIGPSSIGTCRTSSAFEFFGLHRNHGSIESAGDRVTVCVMADDDVSWINFGLVADLAAMAPCLQFSCRFQSIFLLVNNFVEDKPELERLR
jgi:hypothetical protein